MGSRSIPTHITWTDGQAHAFDWPRPLDYNLLLGFKISWQEHRIHSYSALRLIKHVCPERNQSIYQQSLFIQGCCFCSLKAGKVSCGLEYNHDISLYTIVWVCHRKSCCCSVQQTFVSTVHVHRYVTSREKKLPRVIVCDGVQTLFYKVEL